MKNSILVILLLMVFPLLINAEVRTNPDIEHNRLIIKFKKNSELAYSWQTANRSGEIQELKNIIGNHNTKPFICSSTLKSLAKCYSNKLYRSSVSRVESLARICVVQFSDDQDILTLVSKLTKIEGIEYAEPASRNRIVYEPNDTLYFKQHYIPQIKADSAWDLIDTSKYQEVLIGIVDTGVDYLHPDLVTNIWSNPGETGLDKNGKDKRTNGIDDDGNGFIDDWHGWDFVGPNGSLPDNDPFPGHPHGTHVSGIANAITNNITGIAGIALKTKILSVKVGRDDPNSTSVENSYDGVLYAATMGCKVINCSWGSGNKSDSESEVLTTATELGSLICAAAGNDGHYVAFFPSAHEKCLSVAAVDMYDNVASFSNFHRTVGISAPGVSIFSTVPDSSYERMSGTSMATPVVVGVAAMVRLIHPELTPLQVKEHLKASSVNIDSLNQTYIGKLGRGRVNALRAVSMNNLKSLILKSYTVSENSGDGLYDVGDTITVSMQVLNVLAPLKNTTVEIVSRSQVYKPKFVNNSSMFGDMATMEEKSTPTPIIFVVPEGIPLNYDMELEFRFSDESGYINSDYMQLTFRPTYRTMGSNNIRATFNSRGNIGYNDYSANAQGEGFKYKEGRGLLFEGSLMLALNPNKVSDRARGYNQSEQDDSFITTEVFITQKPGKIAAEEGKTSFKTKDNADEVGATINHHVYQFNDSLRKDFIFSVYDVINTSGTDFDSLYAGLYFDWDLGPSGSNNLVSFDNSDGFGMVRNVADSSLPWVGVSMLSNQKLNFFAVDNDGETPDNPGVWDGYTRDEKYLMLTSGVYRKLSNVTDVSMVIGAGPIHLNAGDTTRITFALFAGENYNALKKTAEYSRSTAMETGLADGKYNPLPSMDTIFALRPNPTINNKISFSIGLNTGSYATVDIVDVLGRTVKTIANNIYFIAGTHEFDNISLVGLSQGYYFIRLKTINGQIVEQFEYAR